MRWRDDTAVILASGPSMTPEQARLSSSLGRTIAINNTYQLAPWADVLYACDWQWWARFAGETMSFDRWTCDERARDVFGINWVRGASGYGLNRTPGVINTGHNSGYQAINLAYHWGVSRIVLLGFDFQRTHGQSHWHGDHPPGFANGGDFSKWCLAMEGLAADLWGVGVDVINCTPNTALNCFRKCSLEDLL